MPTPPAMMALAVRTSSSQESASKLSKCVSSDSDDNMPLAQFSKKHQKNAAAGESDTAKTKAKPTAKAKTTIKSAAAKKLVTKKGSAKKPTPAKKGAKKSPTPKAKGKGPAAKKAPVKRKTKRKTKPREQESSGDKLVTRSGVLYETKKGEMIQKLLCRWWYALEWPAKKDLRPAPPSYEALEGYPGVFICVEGDDIGKLLDVRNKETCPCFTNFAKKSSEELKGLLETALTTQKEALIAHWGKNVAEEANIDRELKWLKSVDPAKADKAAVRALAGKF
ncbi:unnamed protein product [Ectocarpus sp. 12 AP-2014]